MPKDRVAGSVPREAHNQHLGLLRNVQPAASLRSGQQSILHEERYSNDMSNSAKPLIVMRVPEKMNSRAARAFYRGISAVLSSDRPQIVFDMSKMTHIDSVGISVFVQCMRQAMRHDGDIRLSRVLPQIAAIFELTRIGMLFEMYESSTAAAKSFNSVLPKTSQISRQHPALAAVSLKEAITEDPADDTDDLAA